MIRMIRMIRMIAVLFMGGEYSPPRFFKIFLLFFNFKQLSSKNKNHQR